MNIWHQLLKHRRWLMLAAGLLLIAALIVSAFFLPLKDWGQRLIAVAERAGGWGVGLFIIANAIAAALLIPGWVFTVAAGLMYGVWQGSIIAHAGAMAGAALAFLNGRYLFRERVQAYFAHNQKFRKVDEAIGREGWKIVCLIRLSPVIPFFIQNYLYSITSIRFWPYMLCSIVCTFPGTLLNVYLGAAGHYSVAGGKPGGSFMQWTLLGIGLVATLIGSLYIRRLAHKALRSTAADDFEKMTENKGTQ